MRRSLQTPFSLALQLYMAAFVLCHKKRFVPHTHSGDTFLLHLISTCWWFQLCGSREVDTAIMITTHSLFILHLCLPFYTSTAIRFPHSLKLRGVHRSFVSVNLFPVSDYNFGFCIYRTEGHDSSVGIALGYGLDNRGSRVRFPVRAGNFSLHHRCVQNGSGAHLPSYPLGTRGSFSRGKTAGT
jgi:hypothetical protein